uniref:ATP-dependent DNA helicase n=1 Tax=Megaselia scalaris TaxID=36166 RepID=T1GYR2_MEGSC
MDQQCWQPGRKLFYKTATLRLIRSDLKEIFIEVTPEKVKPIQFRLKEFNIHKKFMAEGKASITFKTERLTMFLSNAPPGTLIMFLKTIFIKMTGGEKPDDASTLKNIRAMMLNGKPASFNDISPVTTAEMVMARKAAGVSKSTLTTPSPPQAKKRRFEELKASGEITGPAPKKLYQSSPLVEDSIKLCPEQMEVLNSCVAGKNVFFTGSAGTGKSYLLRKIISSLPPDGTMATASTGVAACLIGGVTLHSFAGIGGGDFGLKRCLEMASRPATAQNWRKCKRLIIDEISMVDGEFFEKIEAVARHVRKNDKPFGGIQLILCGDFLQLPPVVKRDFKNDNQQTEKRFCSKVLLGKHAFKLIGHVNDEISQRLMKTSKQKIEGNGILATQLCSHTNDANSINESKLDHLPGEKVLFKAEDSDPSSTKHLDSQMTVPSQLYLKIGAQVMLLKNINVSNGLVNGARGVVVRIEKSVPIVRFKNNFEYACKHERWIIKQASGASVIRRQVPLKLAWAFSIHKSQGLTLDCVEMSLGKVFEAGQAYVALSRAKSLDSLRILDFDSKQVWANPQVLQYYKTFRRRLMDTTMTPLGERNRNNSGDKKKISALAKIKKSLMDKPLVSIGRSISLYVDSQAAIKVLESKFKIV